MDVTREALNLREMLLAVFNRPQPPKYEMFYFAGTGSQTDFPLPRGWEPYKVYVAGSLYVPGSAEDYTVTKDGTIQTVKMAVAPAVVDVAIEGRLKL